MKLVINVPAFNEEATIGEVIDRIPRQIPEISEIEVIIVDDGSKDKTAEIARNKGATVIEHHSNKGVGAAFSTGVLESLQRSADIMVNMDGDLQFSPEDIPKLIEPIVKRHAGFVTCSRFKDPSLIPEMPAIKKWGNRMVAGIINFITGQKFTDVSCGFRAFNKDTLLRLNLYGDFTYTQETFIDLFQKKVIIKEVPLKVLGVRQHGKSKVANNVLSYGVRSLMIMLRAMRDFKPLKFFGSIGLFLFFLGFLSELFVLFHWLATKRTVPFQSLILLGGVLAILGFLLAILALIADMLGRIKRINEENLYFSKKNQYKQ
jgi:glycosyltransferase involved in cell wall biosynthesis